MIPYNQSSQKNGGKAKARNGFLGFGSISALSAQNRWKQATKQVIQNYVANSKLAQRGALKLQAKPSVKGPEWDPKVRPLDASGRPIHYNTDDMLKQLMHEDPRWRIPLKYQIRPGPYQPPSPQNSQPIPLQPNPMSKSKFQQPYPNNPQHLQDEFRRKKAIENQQMFNNRMSWNGRMPRFAHPLPTFPKVGPNGENLNFGKIYPRLD